MNTDNDHKQAKIKQDVHLGEIERTLKGAFGRFIKSSDIADGELMLLVDKDGLLSIAEYLKKELGFDYPMCTSGVDYGKELEVVHHIYSIDHKCRLTLKTRIKREAPVLPSVTSVWMGVDWHERETAELFGITFEGHPDPRRLLLTDDFEGYPLRKDFKLEYKKD
jgi:NADH-quinone oxidoreductase subunit C